MSVNYLMYSIIAIIEYQQARYIIRIKVSLFCSVVVIDDERLTIDNADHFQFDNGAENYSVTEQI